MARMARSMALFFLVAAACIAMNAHLSAGQAAPAPGPDCNAELVELLPCLDFLTNSSVDTVEPVCCDGLKNISTSSPICLCEFISPAFANQSAALDINATRALELPGQCGLNIGPGNCAAIEGPAPAAPPLSRAVAPAPAPISIVPAPAPSPLTSLTPAPAPLARAPAPVPSPETSAAPGPAIDCNTEIASLLGCLTFLNGNTSTPSSSCCTNLGSVVNAAPQCICALAESSVVSTVNPKLLQELPTLCNVPATLSDCASVSAPSTTPEGPAGSPGSNHGVHSAASSVWYMAISLGVIALLQ
ncbi:unnamed protein product [Calypogeia fissa]